MADLAAGPRLLAVGVDLASGWAAITLAKRSSSVPSSGSAEDVDHHATTPARRGDLVAERQVRHGAQVLLELAR